MALCGVTRVLGVALAVAWCVPARARFHLPVHETPAELAHCAQLDATLAPAWAGSNAVTTYVQQLGEQLVEEGLGQQEAYVFKVVADSEVNAFATCGGHVYVTTALLEDVEDEAELAMVLAHEIAHNAQHHLARSHRKAGTLEKGIPRGLGLAAIPLYLFGVAGLLHVAREYEDEADAEGQKLAMRAGFDGGAMERVFRRWAGREAAMPWLFRKLLSTHPGAAHRIRHAQRHQAMHALLHPRTRDSTPARFVAFKTALHATSR